MALSNATSAVSGEGACPHANMFEPTGQLRIGFDPNQSRRPCRWRCARCFQSRYQLQCRRHAAFRLGPIHQRGSHVLRLCSSEWLSRTINQNLSGNHLLRSSRAYPRLISKDCIVIHRSPLFTEAGPDLLVRLATTSAFFIMHLWPLRICPFFLHHSILQHFQLSCAGLKSSNQPPQPTALKMDVERWISYRSKEFHDTWISF